MRGRSVSGIRNKRKIRMSKSRILQQYLSPPSPGPRLRYAVIGLSQRGLAQFVRPLLPRTPANPAFGAYAHAGELVGILDADQLRMEEFVRVTGAAVPCFRPEDFDRMIRETRPDRVVVAVPDGDHAEWIVRSLRAGCDVISEKPVVTDCVQAEAVLAAEEETGRRLLVAHNYRFLPAHLRIREAVRSGLLGTITNIEFAYNVDTFHGASFFYRWNRDRAKSGGLTITKSCHHFDLVHWLIQDIPETVFAFGRLNYFGASSPFNPERAAGRPLSLEEQLAACPYHRHWDSGGPAPADDHLTAEGRMFQMRYHEQYPSDQPKYIYDAEIDIEDTYSVAVRFRRGASMAFSANFSAPWEGYQLAINGTGGRIETTHYTAPGRLPFPAPGPQTITYFPLFGPRQIWDVPVGAGSHGGGDAVVQRVLFDPNPPPPDPDAGVPALASSREAVLAVAAGEAAWRSAVEERPYKISELLPRSRSW